MAIDLEVKHRLRDLEEKIRSQGERITFLQGQVDSLVISKIAPVLEATTKKIEAEQPKVRLCPHCGEKPGYFFHVRACKKQKEKADDGIRTPGTT